MRGGFAIGRFPHCQRNIAPVGGERRAIGFLLASDETKAAVWVPVYDLGDQLRIFRSAAHSRAAITEISRHVHFGRVEDGRGSLGHAATLRFPSPLIEPDVRISRIRLSDWLHRQAHGTNH